MIISWKPLATLESCWQLLLIANNIGNRIWVKMSKIPMISNWVKMTSFDFCTERVQTSSCHHCTSRSRHESLLLKNLIAARSFLCLEWEHLHLAEKILNYKWEGHWDFKFTNWLFFQVLELWEDKEQRKNGGKIKKYWVQL